LIGICTTEVTKEGQAPSTDSFRQEWLSRMWSNHVIRDKIHPYRSGLKIH